MTQERENFELIKKLDVAFTAYILKLVDNYIRLVNSFLTSLLKKSSLQQSNIH